MTSWTSDHLLGGALLFTGRSARRILSQQLGFTDRAVSRRIAALQAAPPPRPWPLAATVLVLGAVTALGAADASGDLLRLLEPVLA
ncbi:hypothetical protein ACH5A3_05870 [Streptomyces echinatus]|uniref:hypothetical protein n=1 Tax=Streptomyces echinatus TaxID=67293 RepID=UPI0037A7D0EC